MAVPRVLAAMSAPGLLLFLKAVMALEAGLLLWLQVQVEMSPERLSLLWNC
jgi:hypothetical protein